jgi:hypothetical protein
LIRSIAKTLSQKGTRILLASLCIGVLMVGLSGWRLPAQDQFPLTNYKFTLGRIRYSTGNLSSFFSGGQGPPWSHDFPRGERHLMKILAEITKIDVNPDGHIVSFEDDEVFKYPIAYLCEVGFLDLSEKEARNMSQYLMRGGFLIVDDFRGERELENFKQQLKIVFPDRSLEEIPRTHEIFKCFYDITNVFPAPPPIYRGAIPQYLGMSDDHGRLMMVVDYNNDLSEYWEWSDNPYVPIEHTNEAYKYGVNYVIYALTH